MYEYNAIITDVYDGDTFTFEVDLGFSIKVTEKLRLYGINTPEVRGSDKVFGKEVRDHVRDLILGKEVRIQVYKKGKFGRYVADVWFDSGKQLIVLSGSDIYDTNLTEYLLSKEFGVEFMKGKK
jgi:micrococcal nuclease